MSNFLLVNDEDGTCEVRATCNPYVNGAPDNDHVYEEIFDKSKLSLEEGIKPPAYHNGAENGNDKDNGKLVKGVHQRRPVTPTAPFEEDLVQTARKTVPNEYSVFDDTLITSAQDEADLENCLGEVIAKEVDECDSNTEERKTDSCTKERSNDLPQSGDLGNEPDYLVIDHSSLVDCNVTNNIICERSENEYTDFESVVSKDTLDNAILAPDNAIEMTSIGDDVEVSQSDEPSANVSHLVQHSDDTVEINVRDKSDTHEIVDSHEKQVKITDNST